ncbi:hypothetical protein J4434_00310 [Candidatus Woesearchaeota archaeon]|nr:hypothetical protein [Candidatus Woesearchaeota archaeon]
MAQLHFLNRKRIKEIFEVLKTQYGLKKGYEEKLNYVFMINGDNKINIIDPSVASINLDVLHISSLGLYLGELKENENNKEDEIRLSIEGSQIIGPFATKNVVEISEGLMRLWIRGYDIEIKINDKSESDKPDKQITAKQKNTKQENAFVIVKYKNDFFGCGRLKDGIILNHIPKERRIKCED